jgi:crossover junction endodeoxyribonuclease RusA
VSTLGLDTGTAVTFFVPGEPAPQGSKRGFVIGGRAVLVESSAKNRPWRAAVANAALEARAAAGLTEPLDGALSVTLHFQFVRPKSAPKRRTRPETRPDVSKLVRSVEDALTGVLIRDDSLIVDLVARKVYADCAGVFVTVERVG